MPKRDADHLFKAAPLPIAKLDEREQLACLRLIRSENVGPVTFRELINHFGGASKALDALPDLSKRGGRGKAIRICPKADAEAELAAATKAGAEPVFTIEPGYPKYLASIDAPPPLLYVKGRLDLASRPSVAIVGSRMSSAAGAKLARLFAREIGQAGYAIVSGMARGIDGAAHEAALDSGTVAVLAGGVDRIYPPEHGELYAGIAEQGCIVSEQPPGFNARAQDFPRRNRIISGISLGVVIVEAAARSGTLVTARYGAEQGREVFAVPGHPLDPRAEGTNKLLKNGATLVTEPHDVLAVLQPMSGLSESYERTRIAGDRPPPIPIGTPPDVGEHERQAIVAVLGPAPVDLDSIVRATGLPLRVVQIGLMELELGGRLSRPGTGLIALRLDTE